MKFPYLSHSEAPKSPVPFSHAEQAFLYLFNQFHQRPQNVPESIMQAGAWCQVLRNLKPTTIFSFPAGTWHPGTGWLLFCISSVNTGQSLPEIRPVPPLGGLQALPFSALPAMLQGLSRGGPLVE